MKPGVSLCFILLLTLAHSEALQLYSVSSSTTQILPPTGSVSGGTTIYLKGLGFSTTPSQNQVFVGPYPCTIQADGVTQTTLACTTTDTGSTANQYYLPITVTSKGTQRQLTNQQGSFSYLNSVTPTIYNIFPATSVPGEYVRFYGWHRISNLGDGRDMGDVISMKIGGMQCGRFDIIQGPINANGLETISCNQATLQEAGKYDAQEHVKVGYSIASYFLKRTSLLSEKYYYAVLPGVSSVTPNVGTYSGNTLTIAGRGFSNIPSAISVDVNGTICDVTSSTLTQIVCKLRQKQLSDHSILSTNSASQSKGYKSGSGLTYKRYGISSLTTKTPDGLRAAIAAGSSQLTLQEEGYRGQIQSANYYGSYYGQVFTGYFTAPADGIYTFLGVADDSFAVYLSDTTYGSAQSGSKLIYSDWVQHDNFFISDRPTAQANVTLVQGRSYYLEVYHINNAGAGWLRVAVSVPNSDTTLEWQTHTVHKMELSFTNDPEIVQFRQTGGTAGRINLTIVTRVIGKPPTVEAAVIDYNANISSFISALNSFYTYNGYDLTGSREMFDVNGVLTTDQTQAHVYCWTVQIRKLRPTAATSAVFTPIYLNYAGTQSFTQNIVHPHGPLISGTFGLSLGGNTINAAIGSGASAATIQGAIRGLAGFSNVVVDLITSSSQQAYGATWIITYYGVNTFIPDLTIDTANLLGGLSGTKPTMTSSTLRYYSSNLLFDPIDFNLLSTASAVPNVLVTVNSMPSVCVGSCGYTFLFNTPVLSSATRVGPVVTLSLTDPANLGYTLNDVDVQIGGQKCTIVDVNAAINNFQCQLPTNSDGTAQVEAGSYLPIATVNQVGVVANMPAVTAFDFPLTLTSLNFTSGTQNGGYQLLLTGTGFPLTPSQAFVTLCGVNTTITTISNTQVSILVPPCAIGAQSITISSLTQASNSLPYTYIAGPPPGQIYTVVPQSHNPALKGTMEITGRGFGVDSSAIRVDLANSSGKVYPMRVLNINDSYIKVGIPGGLAGQYSVQVNLIGVGEILPSSSSITDFAYELVFTSVSPATGSYNGGTLLHLKGLNFAPALDQTLIYVGNELNWFCVIQTLNTTDAFCRTPAASPYYNISLPQTIYMQTRLMAGNTCASPAACQFTYMNASSSPSLTGMSTNSASSGSITLTGALLDSSTPEVVLTNKKTGKATVVAADSFTANEVRFTLPTVESGQYNVKVRVEVGQTNGYLLTVTSAVSATTPGSISTEGCVVTMTGRGLPDGWPNAEYELSITNNNVFVQPVVLGSTPSALSLLLPQALSGQSFLISLTPPQGTPLSATISVLSTSTPTLTLTSSSLTTPGVNTLTFTKSNLLTADPDYLEIYSTFNPSEIYNVTITGAGQTSLTVTQDLPAGSYGFRFYYVAYGYASCPDVLKITISQFTMPAFAASFNGGTYTITANGLSPSATLNFAGFKTQLIGVGPTSATAVVPPMVSTLSQTQYTLKKPQKLTANQYTPISDTSALSSLAFDHLHGTIYSSSNAACYIGIDVGSQLRVDLTRIRIFPNSQWMVVATYLIGATIQASVDGVTYTTISTIDSTIHSGWNIIPLTLNTLYRFVRFVHDSTSKCQIAELEITGVLHTAKTVSSLSSFTTDVVYEDGANSFVFSSAVQYRQDHTPVVSALSRINGDVFGGYNLTLTGQYLSFATPSITIDGQPCSVLSSSSTSIACNVSSRLTLPTSNSFTVSVGTNTAVLHSTFSYVLRWSDIRTWGTDMPPVDGDLVFVPAGMNLLVDQSTPKLQGILVQNGTLTFADQIDMTVDAGFITLVGGKFVAGTETSPYQHKLTFTMYGGYYTPQQPIFGNKGIGCLQCHFSMYGTPRLTTWTQLQTTVGVGDTTLTVQDAVDWQIGEQIVVASTSFNHKEAEQKTITAVSGKTITVDSPFAYQHYAGIQNYSGSDQLEMRAEVGLLTRNIKMMGDSTSVSQNYGSHLMMAGSAQNGLLAHIAYSEFTHCGQPKIIGRYCIHFHMNGDVTQSYAKGNAVHHSMARVITLHGVHFLTVQDNVGYSVSGHNYFIEDGIQTHNLLMHNLAVSSLQAWTMLQTDISVASFWITHPSNHFMYNHAAGSDFYGFWYEIKPHPDGPSATGDVCPMGNALGEVHHNAAHSNVRFGLRIFKLCPRTYPCGSIYKEDQIDPWGSNPGVISTFHHFTVYKNGECGLLAEQTGNLVFENFVSAENKRAGAQFYISQHTKTPVQFRNSILVGQTLTNFQFPSSKGIITPRVGNIRIDNIRFYHFGASTHSLQTCSNCDNSLLFSNTVQQAYISNITYTNVTGYKLFMNGHKKDILYDLDGSFSTTQFDGRQRSSAAITFNWKHMASDSACSPTSSTAAWDNTIICDSTVKVIGIAVSQLTTSIFDKQAMKVEPVPDVYYQLSQNTTSYSQSYSIFSPSSTMDSKHNSKTLALPYIVGKMYNLWWLTGLDFSSLKITSSDYLLPTDDAVLFRFNYTLQREAFDIGIDRPNSPLNWSNLLYPTSYILDSANCTNSEYYHDDTVGNRTLQLCVSAKNRTYFETAVIKAISCRYLCPAPPGTFIKQSFVRYWSNTSQWPQGRLPAAGEDVYVNGNWTIIMDIDPAPCGLLEIDGDVIIQDKANRYVSAKYIWIKAGSITAGSATEPFLHELVFELTGLKNDSGYTFDLGLQGSKIFVVTGKVALYGKAPTTVRTKLTATAFAGATEITVQSSTDWAVGDSLILAPSFNGATEQEQVTITAISGQTITFSPALTYTHYGAPTVTISNSVGQLDTRTSVGHQTRTIKFVSGADSGWGYHVWVYQMWEGQVSRTGVAVFDSVQFTLGGQYDTHNAVLNLYNNMDASSGVTKVNKCSFSMCRSFCLYANGHSSASITNNVFFEGRLFHIKLTNVNGFIVNSNLMVGAIKRPTTQASQAIACLQLLGTTPVSSNIQLQDNICQGSAVNGYALPFLTCSQIGSNPFKNNVVGSAAANGYLLYRLGSDTCLAFSGVRAYGCGVGQMASPPGTASIAYSNYILADNKLGISLRFGLAGNDRTATLADSFITAVSRPTCAQCYISTKCTNIQAIRLLAVTVNGQSYPRAFDSGFDVICKEEVLDAKAYLTNVVFQNYKTTYTEPALTRCSSNYLFRPHPNAPDLVGSTYLWNSPCNNCDFNAVGRFDAPKASQLGWFGGCGNILCTGRNNYLIEDHTGHTFNQTGVILANNSWIGDATPECTYNPVINGHLCTIHQFAVLEYENIAPDYNTRIMWPVSLKYDGGAWQTLTNGYKQWQWSGNEPLNKRLGRFISTLRLFQHYNMTFASNPPDDMRVQLQKRVPGGNSSDWIVVRVYYPFPNMVEVQVGGSVVRPISLLDNNGEINVNTSICGSNKFYYKNRTIQFVVNGASDCMVRVSLTNSVQLSLHFAMNINDFYSAGGQTRLVDRMCAIFQITDQSRVKIVGIYTGSTLVTLMINAPVTPQNQSYAANNAAGLTIAKNFQIQLDNTINNGTLATELAKDNLTPLLSASTTLIPMHPEDESTNDESTDRKNVIIGVSVAVGLTIIVAIAVVVYLRTRNSNKVLDEDSSYIPSVSDNVIKPQDQPSGSSPDKTLIKVENIENMTEENIGDSDY